MFNFTGNSRVAKCTRLEACVSKSNTYIEKTWVDKNDDCLSYQVGYRFKLETTKCMQSVAICTGYTFATAE